MIIAGRGVCSRRVFLTSLVVLPQSLRLFAQALPSASVRFTGYDEMSPLLESGQVPLPEALVGSAADRRRLWPSWIANHDREIRARLLRGEEDTLVNFILFGTSFTERPRIPVEVRTFVPDDPLFTGRIQDFLAAAARDKDDPRLTILKGVLRAAGHDIVTAEQRERAAGYIERNIQRYLAEREQYDQSVRLALSNDTDSSFAATAHLYRDRGLSLDTDFRPNYGVERALAEVRRRRLLTTVRRVAIVGPGLDFADKNSGFDYYPLQSLQPFALVDSLVRLGLGDLKNLQVTLFDISVPVIEHLSAAVQGVRSGRAYTLQLLLDPGQKWNRDVIDYWKQMGQGIGTEVPPLTPPPEGANLERRAVQVQPDVVGLMRPVSLNVVTQTMGLSSDERFDLILGTNVFIYYDAFEQGLVLLNLQSMLAPGGVLITNDLFGNVPGVRLQTVASLQVNFTPMQADQMQVYSVPAFGLQLPPQ